MMKGNLSKYKSRHEEEVKGKKKKNYYCISRNYQSNDRKG